MKDGARAVGIAESYGGEGDTSSLAGSVVRGDRIADGFVFGSCTVGGLDATDAIISMLERQDREDIQYLFVSGIAPAWYNIIDLHELADATELPVLSISYEQSVGLEESIRREFDGEAAERKLERYRAQPERQAVEVGEGDTVYVRTVGLEADPGDIVRKFTPAGGRPEPVRVARLAARGLDRVRHKL